MVTKETIMTAVRARLSRVLLTAETALLPNQYQAYRRVVLDEFGKCGLEGDLDRLCSSELEQERQGKGRNI